MPFLIALLLAATSSITSAQTTSKSYWLVLSGDGHTWCGYTRPTEVDSDVQKMAPKPEHSAKLSYSSGKLVEVAMQLSPQSEDWILIDDYTFTRNGLFLVRKIFPDTSKASDQSTY
jgi:mannose-6-phosphate isomerase-like protein (cupin superfamily)